jgi:hypothetical protein
MCILENMPLPPQRISPDVIWWGEILKIEERKKGKKILKIKKKRKV